MEGSILPVCVVLGVLAGVLGVLFSKTIFFFNGVYSKIRVPNYLKPALAGFLTGLAGLFLPYILSSGNGSVEMLFKGELPIVLVCTIFCVKFIITPLCFGSGAAGGIFLPMLMLGSFLGYITDLVQTFSVRRLILLRYLRWVWRDFWLLCQELLLQLWLWCLK